jgi:hypothetical protein
MTHAALATPGQDLSDRAVSLIRTRVPILWGSLIAALVTWASPRLPVDVVAWAADWAGSEATVALIVAAVIYAWYWVWRRLEPRIPVWVVRLVLGSALTPTYAPVVDDVAVITTLPAERAISADDRARLSELRDFLDEGDPARAAITTVLNL